jgi:hypothetical protein
MAHDFSLRKESDRKKVVYFFGYCGGVAYKAFNAHQFNRGLSGSNNGKSVSKEEAIKGVNVMISTFARSGDLYQNQIDEFTNYLENVIKPSNDDEHFEAHFS